MSRLHKRCYAQYLYGNESELCLSCQSLLLGETGHFEFVHGSLVVTNEFFREYEQFHYQYRSYPLNFCTCGYRYGSSRCRDLHRPIPEYWHDIFRLIELDSIKGEFCFAFPVETTPFDLEALYKEGIRCALRITGNEDDAHDAVQTALLSIHSKPKSPEHLRAYFHRAVSRAAIDILRRRRQIAPIDEQHVAERKTLGDKLIAFEEKTRLTQSLQALPDSQSEILKLRYIDGLSHKDIAGQLCVPITTVNNRLAEARRKLRKELMQRGVFAPE